MPAGHHTISTPDGRDLEVWASPSGRREALLLITGTPSAAVPAPDEMAAADAADARYVVFSRPGYGTSTRLPGRSVASVVEDVETIAVNLELDVLHVIGHSGGGPHALACAALLPDRVAACATIAGVAPWGAAGLDWLAGMAQENVEEFTAALSGAAALERFLAPWVAGFGDVTAAQVAEELGGLVSDVDRAALTGPYADVTAARLRHAVAQGPAGWIDDDVAFTRDWGFALAQITCPVVVWQGGEDRMVPYAHGAWLAAHVPGAVARLHPTDGHLSIVVGRFAEIAADVVDRGRRARPGGA